MRDLSTLIFDPRFHGESDGEPRRYESGKAKVEDIRAAINFLTAQEAVDTNKIFALGICQGANWMIEATTQDRRIKGLSIVAGHYLLPETAEKYLGASEIPKRLFEKIPSKTKELVWLGDRVQFQFYEDPVTIDLAVSNTARYFRNYV